MPVGFYYRGVVIKCWFNKQDLTKTTFSDIPIRRLTKDHFD